MKRATAKPHSGLLKTCAADEFDRIQSAAMAAFRRPYPGSAVGQALYWDDLISSFARVHGSGLAAKVFGIEPITVRERVCVQMVQFPQSSHARSVP